MSGIARGLGVRVAAAALGSGALLAATGAAPAPSMTFHLIQIEQVIGGVEGDTGAQVVQLRMRALSQNFISGARLVAYDAAGANPVVLIDFMTNVPNGLQGDRVLVVSPGFDAELTDPPVVADFVMTNPIPASYLDAGRITFENNFGNFIYWSLAFGGDDYTGSNTGTTDNDLDGNFSPPWPDPLPRAALESLKFKGGAGAPASTNNAADYEVVTPAVLTNNARTSFTLVGAPGDCVADFNGDGIVNTQDVIAFLNMWVAKDPSADVNGDGVVNSQDFILFLNLWNAGC